MTTTNTSKEIKIIQFPDWTHPNFVIGAWLNQPYYLTLEPSGNSFNLSGTTAGQEVDLKVCLSFIEAFFTKQKKMFAKYKQKKKQGKPFTLIVTLSAPRRAGQRPVLTFELPD